MGALEQAIQEAIKTVFDQIRVIDVITGTAVKVSETTCEVARDNAPTLYDVRLNAIDDNLESFFTVYPVEGSAVVVARIEGLKTEAVVLLCSEVEKVSIKIEDQTLVMDKNGVVLNDGQNKGVMKVESVVSWMQKVYSDMQTLKTLLLTSPIAGNGAAAAISFNPTTPQPQASTFENEKLKH